jgi:hypothetical protein
MQHINLDNMLTTVVPQLLSVSGKCSLEVHELMKLTPRHFFRMPIPTRASFRLRELLCTYLVRKGH